ncbi:MAG: heme exporter protein CcmD [Pseudomonadota bacterium]
MMGLDLWMRENPLTYIWIGSYAVAFLVLAIEVIGVVGKRKQVLKRIRLMRAVGDEE